MVKLSGSQRSWEQFAGWTFNCPLCICGSYMAREKKLQNRKINFANACI